MQRIVNLIQMVLGGIGLVALVVILNALFQQQAAVTAARRTPTAASFKPTPKATRAPKTTWNNTTLDQIHFGEPQSVFTINGLVKVYEWLPDDQTLLLEIEDTAKEQSQRYRIVTLDTKTGAITEYGRREDSSLPPVWVENAQGVAFVTLGGLDNQSPKLLLGLKGNQIRQVDTGYASLGIEPLTGNLLYLNQSTPDNTIRMFDTGQESFLSSPLGETNLPWGQLRVDPKGKWLASFWGRLSHDPLDLADQQTDTVTDIEFANNANNESRAPWAIDAAWSGNGKKLALVLGYGDRILSSSSLALLNPKTLRWRSLKLPAQFITEIEWAPGNRFLLARGVPKGLDLADPYAFWLVDTKNRDWKEISYFPANTFPEFPFMAWSREGRLAWLEGTSNGFQVVVTKVTPGR